jgi:transposase-like protein
MTSPKLAIADKQEILRLYCETDLSTVQLSKQFGISTSTTLRLLQEMMTPEAYREAVQRKQTKPSKQPKPLKSVINQKLNQKIDQLDLQLIETVTIELSESAIAPKLPISEISNVEIDLIQEEEEETEEEETSDFDPDFDEDQSIVEDLVHDLVHEDIIDDEFDEDDELDSEEDDSEDEQFTINHPELKPASNILTILPLERAELSNICYMVVDKASEMVTRPMRDFKELGKVPTEEINLLALPLFDNHRAARRFSTPNQKVIKFPSSLIHAAKSHLSKKGITRLLYGGQVFAL